MSKRKRKPIGLQNRLEIVIQSLLDFDEEGGDVQFEMVGEQLRIVVAGVAEVDGGLQLVVTAVNPQKEAEPSLTTMLDPDVKVNEESHKDSTI